MSEKKERCAYQGEPGAYSEGCAADVFAAAGRPCEFVGLGSFDEVFASLAAGNVDYAAVPVENTLGGSIHVNYDLLLRYHGQVHILGEHVHRVRHCLLALPGVRKGGHQEGDVPPAGAVTDGQLPAQRGEGKRCWRNARTELYGSDFRVKEASIRCVAA